LQNHFTRFRRCQTKSPGRCKIISLESEDAKPNHQVDAKSFSLDSENAKQNHQVDAKPFHQIQRCQTKPRGRCKIISLDSEDAKPNDVVDAKRDH